MFYWLIFFHFHQYLKNFIPKLKARGIAAASKGFKKAIEVLQVIILNKWFNIKLDRVTSVMRTIRWKVKLDLFLVHDRNNINFSTNIIIKNYPKKLWEKNHSHLSFFEIFSVAWTDPKLT